MHMYVCSMTECQTNRQTWLSGQYPWKLLVTTGNGCCTIIPDKSNTIVVQETPQACGYGWTMHVIVPREKPALLHKYT